MKRGIVALVAVLVGIALVLSSFIGGILFERASAIDIPGVSSVLQPQGGGEIGSLTKQVHDIIQDDALKPSSDESMTTNAIDGMLNSLDDKYAAYFSPKDYADFKDMQKGEFFGIGLTIGLTKDGQPQVGQVFDGTPAARAGIKSGDLLLAVNGTRKAKWDLDDFVKRVRGPLGTKVTLEVKRGAGTPFSVAITRDRIVVPNTETKTFGAGVTYIRLMSFNEPSAEDVRKALAEADKKGAKGYILDLRGNPGGLLSSSIDVASLFIPDGVIVRVDERGVPEKVMSTTGEAVTKKPLVVLVDNHSASASEIVAGALQDYGRAVIVGETSYGKGSVQTMLPLKNGGGVKLTTAHYLTPKKRVINGKGVVPDVVVKMDPRLQEDTAKDTQLQRAIEVLRAKF